MTDKLVSKQVEIDPGRVTAAFGTADDVLVEDARFSDVSDLDRYVEWG